MSEFPDAPPAGTALERVGSMGVHLLVAALIRPHPAAPLASPPPMRRPHRRLALLAVTAAVSAFATFACQPTSAATLTPAQRKAIGDSLTVMIRSAYDLKSKDVVGRFMSLYPDSGRVISASGGRVTTTHAAVESGIKAFWENVGRNMQDPTWIWGTPEVDVLSPDAAAVTMTYRIPHRTPAGDPHTVAGAWTAVFARRAGRWVIVQEHLSEMPAELLAADTSDAPPAHAHH